MTVRRVYHRLKRLIYPIDAPFTRRLDYRSGFPHRIAEAEDQSYSSLYRINLAALDDGVRIVLYAALNRAVEPNSVQFQLSDSLR